MRLLVTLLLAGALGLEASSAAATPIAYWIQPGSFVTQCPGSGSLAPCIAAPAGGIVTLEVLPSGEALLDTSAAPLSDPSGGALALAIAVWGGLDRLARDPLPVGAPFDVWAFSGTIAGAPIQVLLQRFDQIHLSGGTAVTSGYLGPEVILDVTAAPVPEASLLSWLALGGLVLRGGRRSLLV